MDFFIPIFVCGIMFIGMPWVILHYVTKWKQAPRITNEDEQLLDDLHVLARRLEDRLATVERIITADHPDWKTGMAVAEPTDYPLSRTN